MATTLTYGRKLPTDGDAASSWFDNLETNISLDDSHDHDGTDSRFIRAVTDTVAASGWTDDGNDSHSKVITLPSQLTDDSVTFDDVHVSVRDANQDVTFLDVEKESSTTFTLRTNDPTQVYTLIYTS